MIAEGPLPTLETEARGGRVHRDCGGSGCPACSRTGYATVGLLYLRKLAERRRDDTDDVRVIVNHANAIPAGGPATQLTLFD